MRNFTVYKENNQIKCLTCLHNLMSNFLSERLNSLNIYKNSKQTNLANYKPYVLIPIT